MQYESHLYLILAPTQALVASQQTPEQFAVHFRAGSTRFYEGKMIFAEVDVDFRHPYFDIDSGLAGLITHEDGRPKATKFISSYRVLEHIAIDSIKRLFLTTAEGYVVGLSDAPHEAAHPGGVFRVFAEIAPLRMLVLSTFNFIEFGRYITHPAYGKGAPKLFYTQIELDADHFLEAVEARPMMVSPIRGLHPSLLRDALRELAGNADKRVKGLSLDASLETISYRQIRHGFMFASQDEGKFFPMPTMEEIKRQNERFWGTM